MTPTSLVSRGPADRRTRLVVAAPLAVAGLLLSGCGVASPEARPGVAAEVDGTIISTDTLDAGLSGACDYFDALAEAPAADAPAPTAVPRVALRRTLMNFLVRRAAAEALVAENDIELPAELDDIFNEIDRTYADVPEDQAAGMTLGDRSGTYNVYVARALGSMALEEETGSAGEDPNAQVARGDEVIDGWLADHEVDLNPVYGLRLVEGRLVADDGLSVPASDEAVSAAGLAGLALDDPDAQQQLEQYAAGLPDDEVCG